MKRIHIGAGGGYDVSIGAGALEHCGEELKAVLGQCAVAVITDSTVSKLYLDPVLQSLSAAGFEPVSFVFPAGESSKKMNTLSDILEFLAESGLTRIDCVIALGGGVAGDLAGFAAGCYMRGIRYVQLPTTLLAAVDSSVGGKTAVDLSAGKNLAGLFLQPRAVICDTETLKTLPKDVFAGGAAEAVKTAILSGEELFSLCENGGIGDDIEDIIARCVAYKGGIVELDERETGQRKLLNLGHTVGHAAEKCSGYTLPHGQAVAIGTAVIARAADRLGLSDTPVAERIIRALKASGLPTKTGFSAGELALAARSDKKRRGESITLVLPGDIGRCYLKDFPVSELEGLIAAGLE